MKEFLLMNWQLIVIILFLLINAIYLIVTKQWGKLRKSALDLILIAEKEIVGSKAGKERFDHVLDSLYQLLVPPLLRPFITKEKLAKKLQKWFNEIKEILEYKAT